MSESNDHAWLRAALNRLVSLKVIEGWQTSSSSKGTQWMIKVNDDLTLTKNTRGARAFVHGAVAASSATLDHAAAARLISDSSLRVEARRRGMQLEASS